MNGATPTISVIIPVYNGAQFLREAVASIENQTLSPAEIIIVDNASTDDTATVARSLGNKVRCLYSPRRGVSAARNAGVAAAFGELIGFLDADDLWPSDKLAVQWECLRKNEDADIVAGHLLVSWLSTVDGKRVAKTASEPLLLYQSLGAMLIRKRTFQKIGAFDESLQIGEDSDWMARVREAGLAIIEMNRTALFVRRHEGSLTYKKDAYALQLPLLLKKSLERRRRLNAGHASNLPPARPEL